MLFQTLQAKLRQVDPAQQAKNLLGDGPKGMIKMGAKLEPQNVRRGSQVEPDKPLQPTLSEIVKAVNFGVSDMQNMGDTHIQGSPLVRRTQSKGNWGTLFSSYVKSS
jgi:hypothetical protein